MGHINYVNYYKIGGSNENKIYKYSNITRQWKIWLYSNWNLPLRKQQKRFTRNCGIFMVVKTKEDEKLFKKAIEAQENLLKKH